MTKPKTGTCKDCGKNVGKANISNKGYCYDCAKKRMVDYFDRIWKMNHSR